MPSNAITVGVISLDDMIPLGIAATRLAVHDPPAKPPANLVSQILQEERVHRALEAEMKTADLALSERHQLDARELQPFEQRRDIFLIASQSVQGL
jgi:hypothetical protein